MVGYFEETLVKPPFENIDLCFRRRSINTSLLWCAIFPGSEISKTSIRLENLPFCFDRLDGSDSANIRMKQLKYLIFVQTPENIVSIFSKFLLLVESYWACFCYFKGRILANTNFAILLFYALYWWTETAAVCADFNYFIFFSLSTDSLFCA